MSNIIVLFSLIITSTIGLCFILLGNFLNSTSFLEKMCFSFGLGIGLQALELIIYSLFSIPWKPAFLMTPWVLLIFFTVVRSRIQIKLQLSRRSFHLRQKFLISTIVTLLLFVAFEAQLHPLYSWDGYAIWLFKAKVFYIDGKIDRSHTYYMQNSYPYTLPLAITFIYSILGHVDDKSVLLFFFIFYAAISGLLFSSLQKPLGLTKALLVTFLFMSIQNVIRHGGRWEAGYADLALGYYFFSCILLTKYYIKYKNIRSLVFLSVFIGITLVIKNEAISFTVFLVLPLFLFAIFMKKYFHSVILSLSFIPQLLWTIYKNTHHFFPNYLFDKTSFHPDRIITIIFYMLKEAVNIERWNFLWIVFCFSFLLFLYQRKIFFSVFIFALIFLQLITYIVIFMVSPYPPAVHITSIMDRLFLHLAPLALYVIAIILLEEKIKTK